MLGVGFVSEMSKVAQVPIDTEALGVLLLGMGADNLATTVAGHRFASSLDLKDSPNKAKINRALRAYANREGIKILPGAEMRTVTGRILDALMSAGRVPEDKQKALHAKRHGTFFEPYGNAAFVRAPDNQAASTVLDMLRKEHFPGGGADKVTPKDLRKGVVFGHELLVDNPALLSHELGHSTQSDALRKVLGPSGIASSLLPVSLLAFEKPDKAAIPIGALAALAAAPKLYAEHQASNRGIRLMEEQKASPEEVDKAQRSLNRALSTYYASTLPLPATLMSYGIARRFIR